MKALEWNALAGRRRLRSTLLLSCCCCLCILPSAAVSLRASSSSLLAAASRRDLLVAAGGAVVLSMASSSSSMAATVAESDRNRNSRLIRWGIVGLGDVTQQKSGPPFWKCEGSALAAVYRRTPGKAAEWAQRVPHSGDDGDGDTVECVGYDNLDAFLQHPGGLDAVYIATRPGTHLEVCRHVVEQASSGTNNSNEKIRAIYVEKPAGRSAAETQAVAELCSNSHIQLYTAYISRAYPRTQAVRQLLQEGAIGDCINQVRYRLVGTGGARDMDAQELPWRLDAAQSGGGLVLDVGCHLIDRIDYLCGPLQNVKGNAEHRSASTVYDVEDYVQFEATIGASDWAAIPSEGATVSCSWDFSGTGNNNNSNSQEEECDVLEIIGPKGSLRMAAMSASLPISVHDSEGNQVRCLTFEQPDHTAQAMIQAVTDELRGVASAPFLSRADNAIRTSRVMDAVLESYYGNREREYWTDDPLSWPGRRRTETETEESEPSPAGR